MITVDYATHIAERMLRELAAEGRTTFIGASRPSSFLFYAFSVTAYCCSSFVRSRSLSSSFIIISVLCHLSSPKQAGKVAFLPFGNLEKQSTSHKNVSKNKFFDNLYKPKCITTSRKLLIPTIVIYEMK